MNWSLSLLLLFFSYCFSDDALKKILRLCCFEFSWDEIYQDCSLSKYALSDRVRFFIWHHTFNMVAMESFCAEVLPSGKCTCSVRPMHVQKPPAGCCHLCLQFLIVHAYLMIFIKYWYRESQSHMLATKLWGRCMDGHWAVLSSQSPWPCINWWNELLENGMTFAQFLQSTDIVYHHHHLLDQSITVTMSKTRKRQ